MNDMKTSAHPRPDLSVDPDISAIRSMIEDDRSAPEAPAPVPPRLSSRTSAADQLPPLSQSRPAPEYLRPARGARIAGQARRLFERAMTAVKAYDPNRKNIMVTSLVLLLILQPLWIIVPLLLAIAAVLGTYHYLGYDAFWRRVIKSYKIWERRKPEEARQYKLRCVVLSRKWDRFLSRLPGGFANSWSTPDLRAMAVAEAKHDAAMSERLTRLSHEGTY